MKCSIWMIFLLTVCLLAGCVAGSAEDSVETTAPVTTPITAGNTVPGGNCDISIPVEELQTNSETVWVNWVEVELLQPESLNPQEGEPLFRIDSVQALTAFYDKWASHFSFDWGLDETHSFDEKIAGYDEAFFEENSLLIAYVWSGSSTNRFALNRIYVVQGTKLYLEVGYLNHPEVGDCMMAGWFAVAEVAKEDLANVTEYCCQLVDVSDTEELGI